MDTYSYAKFSSNSDRLIAARGNRIKNKAPAEIQITAEQLLREATERSEPTMRQSAQKRSLDAESMQESADQLHIKRKAFEDAIRRNRTSIGTWLKYAAWEEKMEERPRARSIYERVLEVDYRNPVIWLKYAEMEMKAGNIQHTRNVWNRAVSLLPRIDQFWYKWAYFEEKLQNVEGARAIFERWIEGWRPPPAAFTAYIKLEMRYKETERARAIYGRMLKRFSMDSDMWIDAAKWEESLGAIENARVLYKEGISLLGAETAPKIFTAFAKFEIRRGNHEGARRVFQQALSMLPQAIAGPLFTRYTQFEKQFGTAEEMERVVLESRAKLYEQELENNPHAYDTWFERIWLEQELAAMVPLLKEEQNGHHNGVSGSPCGMVSEPPQDVKPMLSIHNQETIRSLFERAVAMVPLSLDKQYWRRYIYLWIYYAVWAELDLSSNQEAILILERAINITPLKAGWSFAKIWTMLAKALIRSGNLTRARRILGTAIGRSPRRSLFNAYVTIELKLKEFDRARKLYERWVLWRPDAHEAWISWASLEEALGDTGRACSLLEIAIDSVQHSSPIASIELIRAALKLVGTDDPIKQMDLLERWVTFAPYDAEPWLAICTLDPKAWERALSNFETEEATSSTYYEALAQIIDGYIAHETAQDRPIEWLSRKRPVFDDESCSWSKPLDDENLKLLASVQASTHHEESTAAIRLLEMARKWRQGEILQNIQTELDEQSGSEASDSAEGSDESLDY